jgi:iron complex transport system substrate-binding protein
MRFPQRIVCLTTEPTEVLYMLGEQQRIAGISGFTTRPTIARKEKPKVAAFTSANIDKILALNPDLVLGFSNLQADIAAELIRAGVEVHIFNQRSIAQMLNMVMTVGSLVGAADKAAALVAELETKIDLARDFANGFGARPIVYFEEWNDPLISGIHWVADLIDIAGGRDCFAELAQHMDAKNRIISDPDEIIRRNPDIIIGSWCGKKFQPEQLMQRPGWAAIKAVQNGFVQEIKSADILQPGPSLITAGLPQLQSIIQRWNVTQSFRKHWD